MICDTTFLSHLHREQESQRSGPATNFLGRHRTQQLLCTAVTAGEIAVIFPSTAAARAFLARYRILRLTPEIAYTAAEIDRQLIEAGRRLGENDTWIAGFCRYYGQALISRDTDFDRVRGLRRVVY